MTKKEAASKPEREGNPEPAPLPLEEIRRELGISSAEPINPKAVRDTTAMILALERAGFVTVNRPGNVVAPVVAPLSPIPQIEQYLTDFEKLEKIGQRLHNPSGFDSFMDSKFGGEVGSAVGTIMSDWSKAKIHSDSLDKEIRLEQMKLQRVQIEKGIATTASPANPAAPPAPHSHLSPESEALIRVYDERVARLERQLAERAPAAPVQPPTLTASAAALRPPARSNNPDPGAPLIRIRCAICSSVVKVRATNMIEAGDAFALIHPHAQHAEIRERAFAILDAMQTVDQDGRFHMTGPAGRRELVNLQKQIFEVVPEEEKATSGVGHQEPAGHVARSPDGATGPRREVADVASAPKKDPSLRKSPFKGVRAPGKIPPRTRSA